MVCARVIFPRALLFGDQLQLVLAWHSDLCACVTHTCVLNIMKEYNKQTCVPQFISNLTAWALYTYYTLQTLLYLHVQDTTPYGNLGIL